jgi:NAD-dependent protein deacetylases, SIR2 family
MNSIQSVLHDAELDNLFRDDLCIFAGAGISFSSGIPLVKEIKKYIVEKICDDPEDQWIMLSNPMPFEVFMEILFDNFHCLWPSSPVPPLELLLTMAMENFFPESQSFFTLFGPEGYEPNANHYFIAQMLDSGQALFAVTTNFDTLIEKAYFEITGRELVVFCSGEDIKFGEVFPFLLKLHGDCRRVETILTTVANISKSSSVKHCEEMIGYTFKSGPHTTVLSMGYSFSDVFDIVPAIRSLGAPVKKVINIKHISDNIPPSLYPIGDRKAMFATFDGYQIEADTDQIVQYLSKRYLKKESVPTEDKG